MQRARLIYDIALKRVGAGRLQFATRRAFNSEESVFECKPGRLVVLSQCLF